MAGNIPVGSMSTTIKINGAQSVHTLRELKQAVQSATSAWKAQRAELASVGKSTEAAESKYKGLGNSIKKQKDYISGLQSEQKRLQEAQKSVDRSTQEGRQEYGKYNEALQKNETQLHSAETRLSSLSSQQSKAKKSLDYYKSGLADAQKQLRSSSTLTRSYVERLQAEGKTYEASKAKLNGYKDSIENLSKQEKIQEQELSKIASESGKTSDAYRRQQVRVNETATSLAKAKTQMHDLNETMQHSNPSFLDRIKNKLNGVNKEADETHHTFRDVFMGSALGNALSNSLSNIGSGLLSAYHNGMDLNLALSKVNGRFHDMGLSRRQISAMDKQMSELKGNTLMTGENVANVQSKMLGWSNIGTKGAMQMTKMIAGVGDSSRITGDQVEQLGIGLTRVGSTGKVTYSALNRVTKLAPTFMTQLARGAGMSEGKLKALLRTGKVTQTQFQRWMANAAKYSNTAFSKFGTTQAGAMEKIKSKWDDLERKMTAPIFSAKTTGLQALKDLLTSKTVTNGAKAIGNGIANVIHYLDEHKKDISDSAKDLLSITGTIAKDVWHDFASIVGDIGRSFGWIHGNASKSAGPLHQVRLALDGLAKNKGAVKAIATTLLVIAGAKLLNTANNLFHINKLLGGSLGAISGLTKGLKGVQDFSNLKGPEKAFANLGKFIRSPKQSIVDLAKQFEKSFPKITGLIKTAAKKLKGFYNSMKSMSTGQRLGVGIASGAVVAAPEVANAIKDRHSANKRSKDIGGGIGAIAGGAIASVIPGIGPLLAPVGAILGKYAGRWAGQMANKFIKWWQKNHVWQKIVKGAKQAVKNIQKAWHGIGKWFGKIGKDIQHNWHGMTSWFGKLGKNMAKGLQSSWKGMTKWFSNIGNGIHHAWRGMTSWFSKLGHGMAKGLQAGWRNMIKWFTNIGKGIKAYWNTLVKFYRDLGRNTVNFFKHPWKSIVSWFKGIINGIKSAWNNFWDHISGPIKTVAKLLQGKLKVGNLHLANGTDWHRKYGVPVIVNDAAGSNYREGLINGDGSVGLFPAKRNLPFVLRPDQDIINGDDMARMFHLAGGTSRILPTPVLPHSVLQIFKREIAKRDKRHQDQKDRHARKDNEYLADKRIRERAQRRAHEDAVNIATVNAEIARATKAGHPEEVKQLTKQLNKYQADQSKQKKTVNSKRNLSAAGRSAEKNVKADEARLKRLGDRISSALSKHNKARVKSLTAQFNKLAKDLNKQRSLAKKPNPHAGQTFVDEGLLAGTKRRIGHSVWISDKLFKQLTTKKKKKKSKKRKTKRRKTKRRKSTRRRTTTRRSTTRSTASVSISSSALSGVSSKSVKISAKVSGSKQVKALSSAIKRLKNKKFKIAAKASGTKAVKSLRKAVRSIKSKTHHVKVRVSGTRKVRSLQKDITELHKRVDSLTKALKRDTFGKDIAKQAQAAVKSLKGNGNFAKIFSDMSKKSVKDFKDMTKSVNKYAINMAKTTKSNYSKMQKGILASMKAIRSGVNRFAKETASGFNTAMHRMIGYARNDMKGTITQINRGIGGINTVLKQFGGNSHVIKTAHFAAGTDANGRLTHDTLAIVNDAKTGPRQEALVSDRNDIVLPHGNNLPMFIPKGWGVLNGSQTASLGFSHFAKGSGLSHSALRKLAKKSLEHFAKAFKQMFTRHIQSQGQDVQKDVTGVGKNATTHYGNPWSQAMWQVINNAIGDAGAGGTREAFLKYAEKEFAGVTYRMGAASKTLSDCSGMVMQALRHFHIDIGRTTVAMQDSSGTEYLGKSLSKTLPGDLVIFGHGTGAAGHVGIIKNPSKGTMFNETPPYARTSRISDDTGMGYGFYRVKALHNASKKNHKQPSKRLMRLARKELGKSAIKWIKDHLGDNGLIGAFKLAGDIGDRAIAIAKALKRAVPDATRSGLAAIIGSWIFESGGLNPKAINPSGGASGFGQWKDTRLTSLKAYAKRHGKSWTNPALQLSFALHGDTGKTGIFKRILTSHGNVASLAYDFSKEWERGGFDSQHAEKAREIYATLRHFKNGGIATVPSIFGEKGPEMAIPLIPTKATRAWSLIGKAIGILSSQAGYHNDIDYESKKERKEERSFRQAVIMLLTQLVAKSDVAKITLTTPAGRALWSIIKPFVKSENRAELIRVRRGLSGR